MVYFLEQGIIVESTDKEIIDLLTQRQFTELFILERKINLKKSKEGLLAGDEIDSLKKHELESLVRVYTAQIKISRERVNAINLKLNSLNGDQHEPTV